MDNPFLFLPIVSYFQPNLCPESKLHKGPISILVLTSVFCPLDAETRRALFTYKFHEMVQKQVEELRGEKNFIWIH